MFHLMLITNRRLSERPLIDVVRAAVAGGVDAVCIRERDLPDRELFELTVGVIAAVGPKVRVLVSGRLDVALVAGAAGAHLGCASIPLARARALAGRARLIGYSAHSVHEALAAEAEGVDYVTLSPVFPTSCKPGAKALGLGPVADALARLTVPIVALGGVAPANLAQLAAAGVRSAAVISAIYAAPDPESAARELRQLLA